MCPYHIARNRSFASFHNDTVFIGIVEGFLRIDHHLLELILSSRILLIFLGFRNHIGLCIQLIVAHIVDAQLHRQLGSVDVRRAVAAKLGVKDEVIVLQVERKLAINALTITRIVERPFAVDKKHKTIVEAFHAISVVFALVVFRIGHM